MNSIEKSINGRFEDGRVDLRPLDKVDGETPVLTAALIAAVAGAGFAAFMAGNAITDYVGEESAPSGELTSDPITLSGPELVEARRSAIA